MVKNLLCNAEDVGSVPGWETKIPHATCCGQNINRLTDLENELVGARRKDGEEWGKG